MKSLYLESHMSDISIMAQRSNTFDEFVKIFKQKYSSKGFDFKNKDFLKWLKELYNDNHNTKENIIMKRTELEQLIESVIRKVLSEKAVSKAQQKFMSMVYAVQKGDLKPSDVSPEVAKVAKTMKKKDVKDFAETPHKGLPDKVSDDINKDNEIQEKLERMITSVLRRMVKEGKSKKLNELSANPNANRGKWDDWKAVAFEFENEYDSNPKATSNDLNYFISDYKEDHKIKSLMLDYMVLKLVQYLNQHGFKNIIRNYVNQ